MKKTQDVFKKVHYITYEYDTIEEKEVHIHNMENNDYECLDRFEDAKKATYRKFLQKEIDVDLE